MYPQLASAYDRAITVFSPDGRLLQVEYALVATKRTPLAVGMRCGDGVILATVRKHVSPLASLPRKIYQIDEHIGAIAAGLVGDGLVLIDRSRIEAQYHRLIYGEPITVETLAKRMALFKQQYTQYAGLRPFGVIMIFGGVDRSPGLYVTHPGGAYYAYSAFAVGKNSEKINEIFKEKYKESLTMAEGLKMIVDAVKTAAAEGKEVEKEGAPLTGDLEVAIVSAKDKKFRVLSREEIEKLIA